MAIVRWDPLKDLMAMHDRINKMFNDSLDRQNSPSYGDWMPPVDIYETESEIVVTSELPGIDENNVDIQVAEGILTIKGEKKYPLDRESDNYYRLERSYGKFQRSFAVPGTIDVNSIKANLKDGILKITLKKRGETRPTVIKVETE